MNTIVGVKGADFSGSHVLLLSKGEKPESLLLSKEESLAVYNAHTEKEINVFEFNRLSSYTFVQFVDKSQRISTNLEVFRKAGNSLLRQLSYYKIEAIAIETQGIQQSELCAYIEGMALGNYKFGKYKTKETETSLDIKTSADLGSDIMGYLNLNLEYIYKCRDLVNEPVSAMNTQVLAEELAKMGAESGLSVEVMGRKKIEALKMGGLLAVNKGSLDPPAFVVMEYKPADACNEQPLVLVGKGVVFDTGGLNIKTGDYMNGMKCDMAGAATVASIICLLAKAEISFHVIALIPITDNRPGNNAMAPGDIITMHNGCSVEVLNTDAEGRLILADALSYASRYNPMLCITFATLTGAASRAIGRYGIVAMEKDAGDYLKILSQCGEEVYERLAIFPFWDEYDELIKSELADLKNIGGTDAGMITAGKFLAHFTSFPFIHLDIAGPAFLDKPDSYRTAGGTGIGIRLINDFCLKLISDSNH